MHYFKPYIAWDSLSNFGWSIDATRYLNRPASIQDSVQSNLRSNQINCHGKKQESLTVSFREKETKNVLLSPSFSFFIAFCSFIFLKNSFRILPKSSKHTDSKFKAFLTWKKKHHLLDPRGRDPFGQRAQLSLVSGHDSWCWPKGSRSWPLARRIWQSILPAGDGVVGFNVGGSSVGLVLQYRNHACWMSLVLSPRVFPRLVSPFLRAIVVWPFMLKARES